MSVINIVADSPRWKRRGTNSLFSQIRAESGVHVRKFSMCCGVVSQHALVWGVGVSQNELVWGVLAFGPRGVLLLVPR